MKDTILIHLACSLFCLLIILKADLFHPPLTVAGNGIQKDLNRADTITVQDLQSLMRKKANVKIVDVRLLKDVQSDPVLLASATWQDPNQVDTWARSLPKDTLIVVYCVHGHKVSQLVAERLFSLGYRVRKLAGGMEAWKAAGGATVPFSR